MNSASQQQAGEVWRPGVPQPMTSSPGEQPGEPEKPGNPAGPHVAPDHEIQLPDPGHQPGSNPAERRHPEVPGNPYTREIPEPPPHEVPTHDPTRAGMAGE
ncbi:uncharacterized protein SOCE26_062260 [Sorangium cellulosum]|uniref:Uncharacterized protein n=1 Tax=Sorangium cellulosum TaxID=56 RepID=A0A2L0EZM0_SORCE|nr:hypothetical protein [Sorangium cellulosum]AUX44758.1 uncharacterized protein SOCE26_062260 [Sorangium cellulosum]